MPEQYKSVKPPHQNEANPNKKILRLGRKITDVAMHKVKGLTSNDPEYWGLADIVTDEMADIALKMKVRHHYTFGELKKLNPSVNPVRLQELLDEMSYIGLLEYDYGYHYDHNGRTSPQSERRYVLPLFVPGSAELFNMEEGPNGNQRLKDHPALASFFERMTYIPLAGLTNLVPPGGAGIGMHVIPVEKAIEMENQSVDIEHISYWLKKYEGHIGVGQCSCRASRKILDEGCADDEMSWCIGVGDFADYCRETGKGHDITYEEAMAILKRGEENGFVHQITNIDGENKIFGICNCNVNICNALRTSQLFNTPNLSRSAYTAKVDKDACVACGKCVETCPAGAVKLGQKLATASGEVQYPKHELPTILGWGPDKWDEDYRDINRINCYETGTSPCKAACPAHIAVQGYIRKAKEGKYQEALALIKKDNPFPAICGRVCNRRCEAACTRATLDEAVAIDDIKRFIAQLDLDASTRYIPDVVVASSTKTGWDDKIAIIGAGPAGLSCAYYLATMGYKPEIFEKHPLPGGMMTYGIPSYKLEKEVIEAEIDVLRELGVQIHCNVEIGKDVTIDDLREQGFQAFYLACGLQNSRLPGIENEKAKGVRTAIEYLHEAAEDESLISPEKVVVIGGGNVAIDCARIAHRQKAKEITMVSLESRKEMPASLQEIEEALDEGVIIDNGWGPRKVLVNEKGEVTGIELKKCLQVFDPETRAFRPVYDDHQRKVIKCERIIFAIGQISGCMDLYKQAKLQIKNGRPVADKLTYQTSVDDIFVGGDLFSGPGFVIDAIEQGKCAAESLHRYVHDGHMTIGRNRRDFIELDKNSIVVDSYDHEGRNHPACPKVKEQKDSYRDLSVCLSEEQVQKEASRCLGCGASVVDENKCIGCGVCTTRCAFDAIHLYRDHPECSTMVPTEDKFKHIIPYALKNLGRKNN